LLNLTHPSLPPSLPLSRFVCERHDGGRCDYPGCQKLHQGKQGCKLFFFCRSHWNEWKEEEEEEGGGEEGGEEGVVVKEGGRGGKMKEKKKSENKDKNWTRRESVKKEGGRKGKS